MLGHLLGIFVGFFALFDGFAGLFHFDFPLVFAAFWTLSAMAMAWRCGLPAFISRRMFSLTARLLEDLTNGMLAVADPDNGLQTVFMDCTSCQALLSYCFVITVRLYMLVYPIRVFSSLSKGFP